MSVGLGAGRRCAGISIQAFNFNSSFFSLNRRSLSNAESLGRLDAPGRSSIACRIAFSTSARAAAVAAALGVACNCGALADWASRTSLRSSRGRSRRLPGYMAPTLAPSLVQRRRRCVPLGNEFKHFQIPSTSTSRVRYPWSRCSAERPEAPLLLI